MNEIELDEIRHKFNLLRDLKNFVKYGSWGRWAKLVYKIKFLWGGEWDEVELPQELSEQIKVVVTEYVTKLEKELNER